MKNRGQLFTSIAVTFGMLGGVVAVGGQTMQRQRQVSTQTTVVTTSQDPQGPPPPPPPPQQIVVGGAGIGYRVLSSEIGFDLKVIKGSPFSGTAVSESIQTLADGNRIVNKSSTNIYRDSEGRTRREAMAGTGTATESIQMITINDPVGGFSYGLNPESHTAQKRQTLRFSFMVPSTAEKVQITPSQTTARATVAGQRAATRVAPSDNTSTVTGDLPSLAMVLRDGFDQGLQDKVPTMANGQVFNMKVNPPVKTSLGTQTIEGVQADGTKLTTTIPAGQIGNEQPIIIESESWYSPELQAVVMTRTSDPRTGETTYRLTNINRNEPDHSLFEIPSDYTVQEPQPAQPLMRSMKKKQDDQNQ